MFTSWSARIVIRHWAMSLNSSKTMLWRHKSTSRDASCISHNVYAGMHYSGWSYSQFSFLTSYAEWNLKLLCYLFSHNLVISSIQFPYLILCRILKLRLYLKLRDLEHRCSPVHRRGQAFQWLCVLTWPCPIWWTLQDFVAPPRMARTLALS